MRYKTNLQLRQEAYVLRQQNIYLRAKLNLAILERNAARIALNNQNFEQLEKDFIKRYGEL